VNDGASLFDVLDRYVRLLLQPGRMQLDADVDEYVRLGRFAVTILESLDQALGLSLFEPTEESRGRSRRPVSREASESEADPGSILVEVVADVANALASYADRVSAEERLRTRRHAVLASAALLVGFAWWSRRRAR
jgi:hypothetical protein